MAIAFPSLESDPSLLLFAVPRSCVWGLGLLLAPARILIPAFLIRHVPTEALVRRYDELFTANMQLGYEMIVQADSAIMHAVGSGDDPIKAL